LGDADLFSAMTLLLAVSEQTLLELEHADPPFDGELADQIDATRESIRAAITAARFHEPPQQRPWRVAPPSAKLARLGYEAPEFERRLIARHGSLLTSQLQTQRSFVCFVVELGVALLQLSAPADITPVLRRWRSGLTIPSSLATCSSSCAGTAASPYVIDGADAVEALRPYAFGLQEEAEIRALVDDWLAARPGVASTIALD
jgi:hypothetical protein